jgi:hypothetical protein
MANFVGKLDFKSLARTKIMEIEYDGIIEKGVFVPIKDNGIVQWENEWQLWFRAVSYREPKSRFSHFIMKFIPRSQIKKMSAAQLESFANHKIGGMIKVGAKSETQKDDIDTDDFIQNNI